MKNNHNLAGNSSYYISDLSNNANIRMKSKRSKSGNDFDKKEKSPKTEKLKKSLPKQINNDSHVLTHTKSSLQRMSENSKKLTKSKSSANLNKHIGKTENIITNEFLKEIETDFIILNTDFSENLQVIIKKTSNPKNLEITTEIIEKEHVSLIQYNPLPVEIIKLDTIHHSSNSFISELVHLDILTGKIYQSTNEIELKMLEKKKENSKIKKKQNKKNQVNENEIIEIEFSEEYPLNNNQWKRLCNELLNQIKEEKKYIRKALVSSKEILCKKKINKDDFIRRPRSLQDVSLKIEKLIHKVLLKKPCNNLQDLLENKPDIPLLPLNYSPKYCHSQQFVVDLFFCL